MIRYRIMSQYRVQGQQCYKTGEEGRKEPVLALAPTCWMVEAQCLAFRPAQPCNSPLLLDLLLKSF